MLVLVILTIASLGSLIVGSGTCSTRTSRLPCQVTALIGAPFICPLQEAGRAQAPARIRAGPSSACPAPLPGRTGANRPGQIRRAFLVSPPARCHGRCRASAGG